MFDVGIISHHLDSADKISEEVFVPTVVKGFNILSNFREFSQINDSLGRLQNLLFNGGTVHVQETSQYAISYQFLVRHDFGAVKCGNHFDEQRTCLFKISDDQTIYALIDL